MLLKRLPSYPYLDVLPRTRSYYGGMDQLSSRGSQFFGASDQPWIKVVMPDGQEKETMEGPGNYVWRGRNGQQNVFTGDFHLGLVHGDLARVDCHEGKYTYSAEGWVDMGIIRPGAVVKALDVETGRHSKMTIKQMSTADFKHHFESIKGSLKRNLEAQGMKKGPTSRGFRFLVWLLTVVPKAVVVAIIVKMILSRWNLSRILTRK
ncbi:MAG: hypothetical protein ACI9BD_000133 [Candidatus Marinamargulisbacteria bacterium]|jgi:hypothetical protein